MCGRQCAEWTREDPLNVELSQLDVDRSETTPIDAVQKVQGLKVRF